MASGVFHLFRRVGFRLQEEMFEAGIIRVGLDSQRTIIHPRAYRTDSPNPSVWVYELSRSQMVVAPCSIE